jgi:hypothetical protein
MEYFVYLSDVGMQVFICFQDDEKVGIHVFQDEEEVQIERVADVGVEEEDGNHMRKELAQYCVNYKESVP